MTNNIILFPDRSPAQRDRDDIIKLIKDTAAALCVNIDDLYPPTRKLSAYDLSLFPPGQHPTQMPIRKKAPRRRKPPTEGEDAA